MELRAVILAPLLVCALAARTASPLGEGETAWALSGGFLVAKVVGYPAPLFTGDVEWILGTSAGADLRLRYATDLGIFHRFGAEVRGAIVEADAWALAARVHPSFMLGGTLEDGADLTGDIATRAALLGTWWPTEGAAVTLELGLDVEWLVFEHIDGRTSADGTPYLAGGMLALALELPLSSAATLLFRAEAQLPSAPDDPFTLAGVRPRLTAGVAFAP